MIGEDELLAAIRAEPQAADRRLVYADWLDQQGRSTWAEFIRLQLALNAARRGDGTPPVREILDSAGKWHRPPVPESVSVRRTKLDERFHALARTLHEEIQSTATRRTMKLRLVDGLVTEAEMKLSAALADPNFLDTLPGLTTVWLAADATAAALEPLFEEHTFDVSIFERRSGFGRDRTSDDLVMYWR
jgi:uncharacterized protein (TIGR02996 family)